jgi:biotin operon repressor
MSTRRRVIDQRLREGNYPSATDLAEELKVSVKTILRDFEALRKVKAPIAYDEHKKGWYLKNEKYILPPRGFVWVFFYGIHGLLCAFDHQPSVKEQLNVLRKHLDGKINFADDRGIRYRQRHLTIVRRTELRG